MFGNEHYSSDQENISTFQPYHELRKYLKNGTFYFSPSFDLTKTTQSRYEKPDPEEPFDQSFLWNSNMLNPFIAFRKHLDLDERTLFDNTRFITPLTQGYIGVEQCVLGSEVATLAIISKLSSHRAGTRFNSRGIDDDGHVANFVETEFILKLRDQYLSYVEVRGSVPVFWEQTGLSHKVNVLRSAASTQPAVEEHFSSLLNRYGHVNILNLLSQKEGERLLSEAFNHHVKSLKKQNYIQMTSFDFHAICKGANFENASYILTMIQDDLEKFGYFLLDLKSDQMLYRQSGVFRTNCLDCLDRTNVIQSIVLQEVLKSYLSQIEKIQPYWMDAIYSKVSFLWAENGDCLSKMYAGTGALKSSYTRSGKLTFSGLVNDMSKSVNRMYINNFQDKGKQEIIDLLLGKSQHQKQIILQDEVHELISKDLDRRVKEYSTKYNIRIHIGTYNVNGRTPSGESLSSFLRISSDDEPDIIALGIQEIVELTPTQIMSADIEKRLIWQREVQTHLSKVYTTSKYVLLTSEQLVGAAMLIFVRQDNISKIRNIQVSTKK
ncbi:Inositol-1,4,5-trisphosphate 5-phosphatase 1, partial [Basidiobolus ranarum]